MSTETSGKAHQNALDVLLQRMQTESDFPALSEAIGTINRIASSDREGVSDLSNNILKDFALTNKLLKLANAAYYNQVGGGSISTISRAVVILGFDAVRSIALSLILFDNLKNKGHAQLLKEEFIKVLYSAMLAREMANEMQQRDAEEVFIGAMLHNLGRMLALFYFPAEMVVIQQRVETEGITIARASTAVLGMSIESLGIGIAHSWGFPDQLVQSMKKLPDGKIRKPVGSVESLRALAGFSNEVCELVLSTPVMERDKALGKLVARFSDSVPMTEKKLVVLLEKAMQEIAQFAQAVNVNLKQSDFARQAAKWAGMLGPPGEVHALDAGATSEAVDALDASVLQAHAPLRPASSKADGTALPRTADVAEAILTAGLQEASNSLVDDNVPVNDVLHMVLEAIYSGMGFAHVLLCIKDGRHNTMCGKFGFGEGVQALAKAFSFSLDSSPDVFLVALQNNADILITDIDDPKIATRVPAWYRKHVTAKTFVVFPVIVRGKPIGMIYADQPHAGEIVIAEKELSLLKSLRNQAVMAIRQSL